MYLLNLIYLIVLFAVELPLIRAEDVCVKRSSCSCVFPNGTGIDLTPTANISFYTAVTYQEMQKGMHYRLSTYYFHPCRDFKLPINASDTNRCNRQLAMCRHVYTFNNVDVKTNTFNSSDNYEFLGESDKTYFSNDGRSITYDNDPSNNTILLICSQGDTRLHIYSLDDPHELILSFYSKDACLKQIEEAGRSLGSTLLVVFFSILIFYLVLGICTKKFLMGATGIEVIPNLVFWMDLPNLVRDGWAFAISGFKLPPRVGPTSSPDPNSYDSI
ncbi:uncharacterized protein ACR2FA_003948 isoform 2-T2 [Aphomia sociella]